MKVYTKAGDGGFTTLYGGKKVKKSAALVGACGLVDEANCCMGLAANYMPAEELTQTLRLCQGKLFILGAELASDERGKKKLTRKITSGDAGNLEELIDALASKLKPGREFIVPGRSVPSAYLNLARAKVRSAERAIVAVREAENVEPAVLAYINRLSDLLFIMGRAVDEYSTFQGRDKAAEHKGDRDYEI